MSIAKVNFTVKSIKLDGDRAITDVQFDGYDKIYTYRHNINIDNKGKYTLINGFAVYFNSKCEVTEIEFRYFVKSGKKRAAGNSNNNEPKQSTEPATKRSRKPKVEKPVEEKQEEEKPLIEKIKKQAEEEKVYIPKQIVHHKEYDTIKTCIENNIPIYLAGPAGSGKNHTVEQIAKELGLEFYFANSVQQEYKLAGYEDAGGKYHETEFYKAFKNGGLFFLDEMDASIPEVLVLLNAAIANGYFAFPNGKIYAHENFRVVAAGNTVGSGADENYTGRMVLDQATLDRFAIIEFNYDREIEMHLAKGNTELVDFVEAIREAAESIMIRATFSYRCISMVQKLEASGMSLEKIIVMAVVKGLNKDTVSMLASSIKCENKYSKALRKIV